mmetsp:Transcript_35721/g.68527  ORF Transcript_35721/g.68527 Transcript_35721/m.68527 type:complete len:229 (-) Transcript_35721:1938-2624(-)
MNTNPPRSPSRKSQGKSSPEDVDPASLEPVCDASADDVLFGTTINDPASGEVGGGASRGEGAGRESTGGAGSGGERGGSGGTGGAGGVGLGGGGKGGGNLGGGGNGGGCLGGGGRGGGNLGGGGEGDGAGGGGSGGEGGTRPSLTISKVNVASDLNSRTSRVHTWDPSNCRERLPLPQLQQMPSPKASRTRNSNTPGLQMTNSSGLWSVAGIAVPESLSSSTQVVSAG